MEELKPCPYSLSGEYRKALSMAIPALKAQDLQPNLQLTCNLATDCISRQAAIDAVKSRKTAEQSSAGIMRNAVVDFCVDIIKKLPSAQPDLPEWARKVEEYRTGAPDMIHNPLAWALYQVWKEYDR